MAEHYMKLAEKVLSDPEIAFEACSGLLNQKREASRSSHQPNERCIHEVFAEKPDATLTEKPSHSVKTVLHIAN